MEISRILLQIRRKFDSFKCKRITQDIIRQIVVWASGRDSEKYVYSITYVGSFGNRNF